MKPFDLTGNPKKTKTWQIWSVPIYLIDRFNHYCANLGQTKRETLIGIVEEHLDKFSTEGEG